MPQVSIRLNGCRVSQQLLTAPLGLGVLFGKLQQGVLENRQVLTMARMRAEAEDMYGNRLADIVPAADRVQGGFAKDEGATVRKVRAPPNFPGTEMSPTCKPVLTLPSNRRTMVSELRWKMQRRATSELLKASGTSS